MNFGISEEHQMLRDAVRDALERDELNPAGFWDVFCELGLTGICLPEAHGGVGMDAPALVIVGEEVGAVSPGMGALLVLHNAMACSYLESFGEDSMRAQRLLALSSGTLAGTIGLGASGSQRVLSAAGVPSVALLTGSEDGSYLADLDGAVASGTHCFEGLDWASNQEDWVSLGSGDPLPSLDPLAMVGLGAVALGAARSAFEAAVIYSTERKQFGKPISQFQAIQWMLADSNAELDAARLLVRQAAQALTSGETAASRLAAQSALTAAESASQISDRAIQIHGGYGYTREYPVERFWRDAQQVLIGCLGGGHAIRHSAGAALAQGLG